MQKLTLRDLEVEGKRVLVRVDFNVPVEEHGDHINITDDTRMGDFRTGDDGDCGKEKGGKAIHRAASLHEFRKYPVRREVDLNPACPLGAAAIS